MAKPFDLEMTQHQFYAYRNAPYTKDRSDHVFKPPLQDNEWPDPDYVPKTEQTHRRMCYWIDREKRGRKLAEEALRNFKPPPPPTPPPQEEEEEEEEEEELESKAKKRKHGKEEEEDRQKKKKKKKSYRRNRKGTPEHNKKRREANKRHKAKK
jgi:hypothetical protein